MKEQVTILLLSLAFFQIPAVFAQESKLKPVEGLIIDENGKALIGVHVAAYKNDVFIDGNITDQDGVFKIYIDDFDILIISYLGSKSKQITPEDLLFDDLIMLKENSLELDQIVVLDYSYRIKCHYHGCSVHCKSPEVKKPESLNNITETKTWIYFPNPIKGNVEINLDHKFA